MKKNNTLQIEYKEYLEKLNKNQITCIMDKFNLSYQKNNKKDKLIETILDNLENVVDNALDIFQEDEYININYVIKRKGCVVVTINKLLTKFLNNLVDNNLMIIEDEEEYIMPSEIYNLFKDKLKKKSVINRIKSNTREYNLILGHIDTYGIIDFDYFYNNYAKDYKLTNEETLTRIKKISLFYKEFHIIEDKKKVYIVNNLIKNIKEAKEYLKNKNYATYTNEELINIHNFKFMKKVRSYKKLVRFIESHYDVEKGSFKIINKFVLIPYLEQNQLNGDKSKELISNLADKYFEFSKEKYKVKFISLIENLALDYPSWSLRGYSERNKIC